MASALERKLQVIFDVHQYHLSQGEEQMLHKDLDGLARQVEHFPIADLHVLIEGNARSNDVSLKLTLVLPGTTLVGNDHDLVLSAAFQRCLTGLLDNLQAYKRRLGQVEERQKLEKGTHQQLHASVTPDAAALQSAVEVGDYPAFRMALLTFEEGLRKRIGRWVQRYPDFNAEIGEELELNDVLEDVFLEAFEAYAHRPADVSLGDWLESLIDPAIKALQRRRDDELQNISMARSATSAEQNLNTNPGEQGR
jgi:hypothetical protein